MDAFLPALRPEDYLIQLGRHVGVTLAPILDPVEVVVTRQFEIFFPAIANAWQTSLVPIRSPLADHLPLMKPFHVAVVLLSYLVVVQLGMQVMKNFKRLEVKTFSVCHNLMMASLSFYMAFGIVLEAYRANYTLFENKADHTLNGLPMAKMLWLFYVSKMPEFIDTMIMVVKKNNRQISFLHLYHHTSIFFICWIMHYITPTGEPYMFELLNSIVHVFMYGYYGLSALNVKWVRVIKKYITMGQMIQFCLMICQGSWDGYAFNKSGYTGYPPLQIFVIVAYIGTMVALFANFFVKTYWGGNNKEATKEIKEKKSQ